MSFLAISLLGLMSLTLTIGGCKRNTSSEGASALNGIELLRLKTPELQALEPAVRQQLEQQMALFNETQKRPNASINELAEAYGELGCFFYAYQLADAAEPCYLNAQKLMPTDFRWPHYLGYLFNKLNNPDQAIAHFKRALEIKADDFPAMVGLAENYAQQNQSDLAESLFKKALDNDLTRSSAQAGLGKLALSRHENTLAVAHLEAALRQMPEATELYFPLAMAYRGLGDVGKAEASLAKRGFGKIRYGDALMAALGDLISGSHVHVARGTALMGQRKYQEAHDHFRQAVEADPKNVTARINYATTFAYQNKFAEAKAELAEVLRQEPKNAKAHFNLGRIAAWEEGGDAQAVNEFKAALEGDKNFPDANLFMADALMRLGKYAEAVNAYEREIALQPGRLFAHARLVPALFKLGKYEAALAKVEELLSANPDNLEFQQVQARLLAACTDPQVRNPQRALQVAEKSYKAQASPLAAQTLAMAYAEAGNFELAIQMQGVAIKGIPDKRQVVNPKNTRLVAATESELLAMMRADMQSYERKRPCRRPWLANARIFFPPRPR